MKLLIAFSLLLFVPWQSSGAVMTTSGSCLTTLWYGNPSPPSGWSAGRMLLDTLVSVSATGSRVECHLNGGGTTTTSYTPLTDVYYWKNFTGYTCSVSTDKKGWTCTK